MSKTTVTIQIGNSDDKLTQRGWANFVRRMQVLITQLPLAVHFSGHSDGAAQWQNACWVAEVDVMHLSLIRQELAEVAEQFEQDSIALTVGTTEFIAP